METMVSELEAKLAQNQYQLEQINLLLKDNPEDETLLSLKNDLVKVIELTQGLSKLRESKKAVEDAYQEKKDEKVIGQRCMAQRQDGSWSVARIDSKADASGKHAVAFLEHDHANRVRSAVIKPYRSIAAKLAGKQQQLKAGQRVLALFEEDGLFYPALVDEVLANEKCRVTFTVQNTKAEVSFDDMVAAKADKKRNISEVLPEKPVIPEAVRIKETDTEEEKAAKRKKIKSIKSRHRLKVQNAASQERQNSWLNFTKQANKLQGARKKDSIFKSPDSLEGKVGVTGSGHKMTEFSRPAVPK